MVTPEFRDNPRAAGFTLIELLVASTMMIVITGAAVTMLISAMHRQADVTSSADRIGTARSAVEKITADIRQGVKAELQGTSGLKLETFCHEGYASKECEITYSCSSETGFTPARYACTRKVEAAAPVTIIEGLRTDSEVFTGKGAEPRYVGVKVEVATPERSSATVLEDGAALHNAGY